MDLSYSCSFCPIQSHYEATLSLESRVVAFCRFRALETHVEVDWINSNEKRKGYATQLLKEINNSFQKPVLPGIIFTEEALSFWRTIVLEQMK